ncbi:NUDIX domain-containing protein [Candidatus Phycosocius spiralis]|uniref:DNA mismatch repair protein MutT n=1 Tax=Candidatus Phycosocius spiralis TaxID=2815099 RepID=A0ABQ4PWX5_9PROT|nr:NUDIX domain-containing protein [Candidatus Phycosocius spiralis]GIU67497.1 DNA mismatch repair protein MutT [Candidatus Phycosocius spiralis]
MLKSLTTTAFQTWFRLVRGTTLGVRILALDGDNRVCLVRHTYIPGWHLPGGGVERGESGLDAAIKEAREEAGLIVEPVQFELRSIHTNFAHFKGDHILLYRAHSWTNMPTNRAHEIAEYGFFALSDLPLGTTQGTKNRLAEAAGAPISPIW